MSKSEYYETCKYCGANLDPGEKCDCAQAHSEIGMTLFQGNKEVKSQWRRKSKKNTPESSV